MDPPCTEPRNGLAFAHQQNGYFNRVIVLELENDIILDKQLEELQEYDDTSALNHQLYLSYEGIFGNYERLDDLASAF